MSTQNSAPNIGLTAATSVLTDRGVCPAEDLRAGMRVWTLDAGYRPLVWIGRQITCATKKRPVRIKRGTLGRTMPDRDLWIAASHHILIRGWQAELLFGAQEVLAPAAALADPTSVVQAETTYCQLVFERHQVILANGAMVESSHPVEGALGMYGEAERVAPLSRTPTQLSIRSGAMARPAVQLWEGQLVPREQPQVARAS